MTGSEPGARSGRPSLPVLLLAALLCLTSFVTDNFVEPESRLGMRRTIAATYADLLSTVIEEKAFRRIDDGLGNQGLARASELARDQADRAEDPVAQGARRSVG